MTPYRTRKIRHQKSRKKLYLAIAIIAIIVIALGAYAFLSRPLTKVLLNTSMGDIIIQLREDKPITSGNFRNLVQQGKYDGTLFHRIIKGFMIQGGGMEENIPTIPDEIGSNNRNLPYTIAMAKTNQPNSATSEFFINLVDNGLDNPGFDATYTVFGTVISGQDVVDLIANQPVQANPNNPQEISQPMDLIILLKATMIG
jgi:peptidyl-prolyl cis-trans isomerase A (cyclophilin A)/peptidyl-prolyl cis-trans isomerase B (cyclophilin B)